MISNTSVEARKIQMFNDDFDLQGYPNLQLVLKTKLGDLVTSYWCVVFTAVLHKHWLYNLSPSQLLFESRTYLVVQISALEQNVQLVVFVFRYF